MIDSHCHLDHEPLYENINDIISRSKKVVLQNYLLYVLISKVLKILKKL